MCDSVLSPDGHFNPEVVMYRELCAKSQKKRQLSFLQQYYHKLLKQILVSRKVRQTSSSFGLKHKVNGLRHYVHIISAGLGTTGVGGPQWP